MSIDDDDEESFESCCADALDALGQNPPDLETAGLYLGDARSAEGGREERILLDEIDSLLRAGLVDDARHRLRLWVKPKFDSVEECKARYAEQMGRAA